MQWVPVHAGPKDIKDVVSSQQPPQQMPECVTLFERNELIAKFRSEARLRLRLIGGVVRTVTK